MMDQRDDEPWMMDLREERSGAGWLVLAWIAGAVIWVCAVWAGAVWWLS